MKDKIHFMIINMLNAKHLLFIPIENLMRVG